MLFSPSMDVERWEVLGGAEASARTDRFSQNSATVSIGSVSLILPNPRSVSADRSCEQKAINLSISPRTKSPPTNQNRPAHLPACSSVARARGRTRSCASGGGGRLTRTLSASDMGTFWARWRSVSTAAENWRNFLRSQVAVWDFYLLAPSQRWVHFVFWTLEEEFFSEFGGLYKNTVISQCRSYINSSACEGRVRRGRSFLLKPVKILHGRNETNNSQIHVGAAYVCKLVILFLHILGKIFPRLFCKTKRNQVTYMSGMSTSSESS